MLGNNFMESIEFYKKNGYAIFRNLVEEKARTEILDDLYDIFQASDAQRMCDVLFTEHLRNLFRNNFDFYHGAAKAANHSVFLHRLGTSECILKCVRKLGVEKPNIVGRPVIWFQHKQLAKSKKYHMLPVHQEWSNMQGSVDGIVAWMPLNNVSKIWGD